MEYKTLIPYGTTSINNLLIEIHGLSMNHIWFYLKSTNIVTQSLYLQSRYIDSVNYTIHAEEHVFGASDAFPSVRLRLLSQKRRARVQPCQWKKKTRSRKQEKLVQ